MSPWEGLCAHSLGVLEDPKGERLALYTYWVLQWLNFCCILVLFLAPNNLSCPTLFLGESQHLLQYTWDSVEFSVCWNNQWMNFPNKEWYPADFSVGRTKAERLGHTKAESVTSGSVGFCAGICLSSLALFPLTSPEGMMYVNHLVFSILMERKEGKRPLTFICNCVVVHDGKAHILNGVFAKVGPSFAE